MQSRGVTNDARQEYYRSDKVFCIVDHADEIPFAFAFRQGKGK